MIFRRPVFFFFLEKKKSDGAGAATSSSLPLSLWIRSREARERTMKNGSTVEVRVEMELKATRREGNTLS